MTTENEARDYHGRWNGHRAGHRVPIGQPPYELRRKSRREQTPHNAAVAGFSDAINVAEKHRRTLKRRFGYDDRQIGTLAVNYNLRKNTIARMGVRFPLLP